MAAPATVTAVAADDVNVLHNIAWETYCQLNDENGFPATRMAYFEGALEIMTVSARHENWERRIDFLVRALAVAMGMDCESFGSVTMRRKDLRAGIEADACFYFGPMAAAIRGCAELNLHADPAPELAVEVDVSRRSNSKLPLYAALGIGEIWRFHQDELVIYRLTAAGEYLMVQESVVLPGITGCALTQLLADANALPLPEWMDRIRAVATRP